MISGLMRENVPVAAEHCKYVYAQSGRAAVPSSVCTSNPFKGIMRFVCTASHSYVCVGVCVCSKFISGQHIYRECVRQYSRNQGDVECQEEDIHSLKTIVIIIITHKFNPRTN